MSKPSERPAILDFNRNTVYPTYVGGSDEPALIEFSPYSADELKRVLKKGKAGFRRTRRETEIVGATGNEHYAELFDNHFVAILNGTGTPDQQRDALSAAGAVGKAAIVENSLGAFFVKQSNTEDSDGAIGTFDIFALNKSKISVSHWIYDPSSEQIVEAVTEHSYTQPSEALHRKYRRARNNKLNNRKQVWLVREDYDLLETLYDEIVTSVSGAFCNGSPCTAELKADWIENIPLWYKLLVVDTVFGGLAEKNE